MLDDFNTYILVAVGFNILVVFFPNVMTQGIEKKQITRRTTGAHGCSLLQNEQSFATLWYNSLWYN